MASSKRQRQESNENSSASEDDLPFASRPSIYRRRSWSSSRVAASLDDEGGTAISLLLTDPDLLDCPICADPLCNSIYQCENGHIACSTCRLSVKGKCPSCTLPITFNRCRPIEKLIESVRVECENKRYGCKEILIYHQKTEHEKTCPNTACFCLIPSCGFADCFKNLGLHFLNDHKSSATLFTFNNTVSFGVEGGQKHVILLEQNEGVIFILNHSNRRSGRFFDVVCLGPTMLEGHFVVQLSVKCMDTCLSLESVPEVHAKWQQETPNKKVLIVPLSSLKKGTRATVQLCVKQVTKI